MMQEVTVQPEYSLEHIGHLWEQTAEGKRLGIAVLDRGNIEVILNTLAFELTLRIRTISEAAKNIDSVAQNCQEIQKEVAVCVALGHYLLGSTKDDNEAI
jgi:hypothetical protein